MIAGLLCRRLVMLGVFGFVAGCVDSPTEAASPAADNQVAASFEVLAQEQFAAGDMERGEEFRWAGLALRAGVVPSRLDLTNNGVGEVYNAFVHSARWTESALAMRPPLHRSMLAWRRNGDRLQVIIVSMRSDSAPVLHPFSMRPSAPGGSPSGPMAGAKAAYFERGPGGSAWLGVGGTAKIIETQTGGACAAPNAADRPPGVTCELARFGVSLAANFAVTTAFTTRDLAQGTAPRAISIPPQPVSGVKLTFTCATPTTTGC